MRPPWAPHGLHGAHGPRRVWWLARGVHRAVWGFLLLAALLGAGAGWMFATAHHLGGGGHGMLCVGIAVACALWPLAWVATARIVWPLRALARVAGDLQGGQLSSREKLPEGPEEVGEVAHALRGMADRVARQLSDQRALMAAVSHELRSPLGRMRVQAELARDAGEGADPSASLYFDQLQAEIDGMDRLVGDLLAAARIDFEAVTLRELAPADVAARALELAKLPASALSVEGDVEEIRADPTLLARALSLVLDNARRYGGGEQEIRLRIRQRVGWLRFEVEDRGPGFPEGDAEQAFAPFYRGPPGSAQAQKPAGEGLGLALVRQIARAHRGDAGASNRRGGGALVWVELPRQAGQTAQGGAG